MLTPGYDAVEPTTAVPFTSGACAPNSTPMGCGDNELAPIGYFMLIRLTHNPETSVSFNMDTHFESRDLLGLM